MQSGLAPFLYRDEKEAVEDLLMMLSWDHKRQAAVNDRAIDLVTKVRTTKRNLGELESFLQEYGLNTDEGLALMTLAEALLRIPDARTATALIHDKMVATEWLSKQGDTKDLLVRLASFGLMLTQKALNSAISKLSEPVIRKAMAQAMRILGKQFVLGRTIEEGMKNAAEYEKRGYRISYDMLGEGARTDEDADRYFDHYNMALDKIAESAHNTDGRAPGLSVKLSALHPRYEARKQGYCVPVLTEKLTQLAQKAAAHNMALTVDAEEVDRLEISLQVIESVMRTSGLKGWDGFGLALQAYQKRAPALIDHLHTLCQDTGQKIQVRLVKGAYWDTEIKRAQVLGLDDYPVFTRKANTDLSYLACAEKMLAARDSFYPMFATHNAHTIASVLEMAGNDTDGFELQRLHGMGETLHDVVLKEKDVDISIYAPCGSHEELLPYLVRRLLENGASTSFVYQILDDRVPPEDVVADPVQDATASETKRHSKIPLPVDIYRTHEDRDNSRGMDLTEPTIYGPLFENIKKTVYVKDYEAAPLINGKTDKRHAAQPLMNPSNHKFTIGQVWYADDDHIEDAFAACKKGFKTWNVTPAADRATVLYRFADLMEQHCEFLMGVLMREAGKTIDDALAEVREAVDFCRYYGLHGTDLFDENGTVLPGPTGESNIYKMYGRGVFVCISPWNFPLAIFVGQIVAALMAGNSVIAKPAEQTSLIGMHAIQLLLQAGLPGDAIALLPGDGTVGAKLVAHKDVAGVTFTGSENAAKSINRALAEKDGAIVPLIAETGGQNAMMVDSSSLAEQVIDDVIISAFGSAGQRCSALRVLYLQDDVADKIIHMLKGAMDRLTVCNGIRIESDIGAVIDRDALEMLRQHRNWLSDNAKFVAEVHVDASVIDSGYFFGPVAYEIESIDMLEKEVFGPILHIVRYSAKDRDAIIEKINASGYGLTFGLHSRIESTIRKTAYAIDVGNVYVNRTMIGAIVGVQPFGGHGLSGTGPKAGGPHYLPRFAAEKVTSIDTTRQGGNASLVSLADD